MKGKSLAYFRCHSEPFMASPQKMSNCGKTFHDKSPKNAQQRINKISGLQSAISFMSEPIVDALFAAAHELRVQRVHKRQESPGVLENARILLDVKVMQIWTHSCSSTNAFPISCSTTSSSMPAFFAEMAPPMVTLTLLKTGSSKKVGF
jgi:hypothetical protein